MKTSIANVRYLLKGTRLFCGLLVLAAAAVLFPVAIMAAELKEDPAVTSMMRDKMAGLRKAFAARAAKAYAAELEQLLKDAAAQSTAELVTRYASLEVIVKQEKLDGLEPVIYVYATRILKDGTKVDPKTLDIIRASVPLAQTTRGSPQAVNCNPFVTRAAQDVVNPDLEGFGCYGDEAQGYSLSTAGISLPARDACEALPNNLVYRLDLPANIPSASISSIEVVNLAFPLTLTWNQDWSTRKWVSIYPHQLPRVSAPLPADAQTESFTVRVTPSTGAVTSLPVTFPINPGIHDSTCSSSTRNRVHIGGNWNWPIYGNGPRGARVWSATPTGGTSGLPAGLSLMQGAGSLAGHAVVTGTVQAGAVNGVVDFSFNQGAINVTRRYDFEVALRADPVRAAALSAVQTIVRGQTVSLQLPAASGGNGTYRWGAGGGAPLPPGLSVVQNGSAWFVSGTVDSQAPLRLSNVQLWLTSAGQGVPLVITFDAGLPLKVYQQNMILFPTSIVDPLTLCAPLWLVPLVGGFQYGECVAVLSAAQNLFYNVSIVNPHGINNTDDDNHERAGYLIDHINARQYDIVALQEVWDGPLTDAELEYLVNGTSPNYRAVQGPGTSLALFKPVFKVNSGLLTLVKQSLPNPPAPTDYAEIFEKPGSGTDSLANKGFVATRMFVTANPNEFLWVINTHTDAEHEATRVHQLRQIQRFVANLPDTNPVLLLGDLNIVADESYSGASEYRGMLNILTGFDDLAFGRGLITESWYHNAYTHQWFDPGPEKRIDYILVRQGSVFELNWNDVEVVNSRPNVRYTGLCIDWNLSADIICHYSDHFGLRTSLKFRQR